MRVYASKSVRMVEVYNAEDSEEKEYRMSERRFMRVRTSSELSLSCALFLSLLSHLALHCLLGRYVLIGLARIPRALNHLTDFIHDDISLYTCDHLIAFECIMIKKKWWCTKKETRTHNVMVWCAHLRNANNGRIVTKPRAQARNNSSISRVLICTAANYELKVKAVWRHYARGFWRYAEELQKPNKGFFSLSVFRYFGSRKKQQSSRN